MKQAIKAKIANVTASLLKLQAELISIQTDLEDRLIEMEDWDSNEGQEFEAAVEYLSTATSHLDDANSELNEIVG